MKPRKFLMPVATLALTITNANAKIQETFITAKEHRDVVYADPVQMKSNEGLQSVIANDNIFDFVLKRAETGVLMAYHRSHRSHSSHRSHYSSHR